MRFLHPWYFLSLVVIPLYLWLRHGHPFWGKRGEASLAVSDIRLFGRENFLSRWYHWIMDALVVMGIFWGIVALARPIGGQMLSQDNLYGVDIVLVMDVSETMLFVDEIPSFLVKRHLYGEIVYEDPTGKMGEYTRLESAKRVIKSYVEKQSQNRIGVVLFGTYAYTLTPLTYDRDMVLRLLEGITFNPANNRTAIGMGVATAINRFASSKAKSKVIILLTDGMNNAGLVDPKTATSMAREKNIRIYTIGFGNPDAVLQPVDRAGRFYVLKSGESIDEKLLAWMAEETGGKYYRAHDRQTLATIYDDIDRLEKSKITIQRRLFWKENFWPFAFLSWLCFMVWIGIQVVWVRLP
ncbi:MAG: VWA domain-containing protein [Brevinematales bacterium]|nr:VWA domain-containing protein [Brevinematales bacterium]